MYDHRDEKFQMKQSLFICLCVSTFLALQFRESNAQCRDRVNSCDRAAAYCNLPRLANTLRPNPQPSNPEPTPSYVLWYFAFRFRGEPARMILNYAGIPFTDKRFNNDEFQATIKPTLPNGQVPLLQVNDKNLTQSNAIYRFLGRKYGLMGQTELETAYLDQVAELFRELIDITIPFIQLTIGSRTDLNKADEYKKFIPAINKYCKQLEGYLDAVPSGFFGRQVSWVDFYAADFILTLTNFAKDEVAKYPKVLAHQQKNFLRIASSKMRPSVLVICSLVIVFVAFAPNANADLMNEVRELDIFKLRESPGGCPTPGIGGRCPEANPIYFFKCCGYKNESCCFRLQDWLTVLFGVLIILILLAIIINLIRCIFCF
ncbi:Glutathione S-transferase protein [Aphelenchoides bicaudatus]|nr:Glutathione S-transferase protein [Aphelenchoides bicaudatus]